MARRFSLVGFCVRLITLSAVPLLAANREPEKSSALRAAFPISEGVYDVYAFDQPDRGVVANFSIKATTLSEFIISSLDRSWDGAGRIAGKNGSYIAMFVDGRMGDISFEILADGNLKGHVTGLGADWWYVAKPREARPTPPRTPATPAGDSSAKSPAPSSEIEILLANAPVLDATAVAQGEEIFTVARWLTALGMAERVEEARRIADRLGGKLPKDEAMSFVAIGLGRAGKIDEARSVLQSVPARSMESKSGTLVRILVEAQRFEEAWSEARKIENDSRRSQELEVLISSMAEGGKAAEAERIVAEASGTLAASMSYSVYEAVAKAYVRGGRPSNALAMVEKIEAPGLRASAIKGVALELVKAGRLEVALDAAAELSSAERNAVWFAAAQAHAAAGRVDATTTLAPKLESNYQRVLVFSKLARALYAAGQQERAAEMVAEARAQAGRIYSVPMRAAALASLSTDLAEAGRLPEAEEVAKECGDHNDRARALSAIGQALAKAGRFEDALERALMIRQNRNPVERSAAIARVVAAAAVAGKVPSGVAIMTAATGNPRDQLAVVEGFAGAGRAETASAAAGEIKDADSIAWAWWHVAQAFARARKFEQARQAAERCAYPMLRLGAYTAILTAFAAERNPAIKARRGNARLLL